MIGPVRILDTGAVLQYTGGKDLQVAATLAAAGEYGGDILVPTVCLAEAARSATGEQSLMLDLLSNLPVIQLVELTGGDALMVGTMARFAGELGLAQACLVAMSKQVPVMTTQAKAALSVLGDERLVFALGEGSGR